MQKVLVSRCLLGHAVRYDAGCHGPFELLQQWQAEERVVALCPEVSGGLPIPRPAAEIAGGQGALVLDGLLPVLTQNSEDVTAAFLAGAAEAVRLVQLHGIRLAVLKARSPSCGNLHNYDGSFSGRKVAGVGVTAAALQRQGVCVFNEEQLAQAQVYLQQLDAQQT